MAEEHVTKRWTYEVRWTLTTNVPAWRELKMTYPPVVDPALVGSYPALTHAGGGFVWDEVLEYRVWCHPELGSSDEEDGSDYFYAFATYEEAVAFAAATKGAEAPLALVLQREYIGEPHPGCYVHVGSMATAGGTGARFRP